MKQRHKSGVPLHATPHINPPHTLPQPFPWHTPTMFIPGWCYLMLCVQNKLLVFPKIVMDHVGLKDFDCIYSKQWVELYVDPYVMLLLEMFLLSLGFPDLLDKRGIITVITLLKLKISAERVKKALKWAKVCCVNHESNRQVSLINYSRSWLLK